MKFLNDWKNPYSTISKEIWLLACITLISKSGNVVLIFLPLYLMQSMHFNISTIAQILSMYGLGAIFGSYFGGIAADKFGCIKVQISSLVISGLLYFCLEHANTNISIIYIMALLGFFVAAIRPATAETIAKCTVLEDRVTAYALHYQAVNLGNTIGPALGGIIAGIDYIWIFRLDGLASILAALAMSLFFGLKDNQHKKPLSVKSSLSNDSAWVDLEFILFLCFSLLLGLCFFQLFNNYPIYLKKHYLISEGQFGIIMAINGLLIIVLQGLVTNNLKKYNTLKIIGIGGLIISFGLFILPFYTGFYYAAISMIIITIGEILALPFMHNFVVNIAPTNKRGQYLGIFASVFSIPLLLAPSLGAYIYTKFGPSSLWQSVGLIGIIVFFGFMGIDFLNQRKPLTKNESI